MSKIPLVASPFPSRSLAAAASELTNLYVETIDNPADQSKNAGVLFLTPGRHLFTDLNVGNGTIRGFWSGGGRLFVAQGTDLVEVDQNGSVLSRHTYTAVDDGLPVEIFGNANQLLVVSGGQAYCDNGAGPIACRFQLNGTVTLSGTAVTWQSGDEFPTYTPGVGDPLPDAIFINGIVNGVASWNSATSVTLTSSVGGGTGVVEVENGGVFLISGDPFDLSWAGATIVINSVNYTIASVSSTSTLTLTDTDTGIIFGATYTVTDPTSATYSTAGGDLVTALSGAFLDGSFFVQRPKGGSPDLGRQVNFSGTFDGTSWDGLDFITKEGAADYLQSILVDAEILYLFGTDTIEAWQTDPNTGLPVRVQGQVKQFGSISRWAPNAIKDKVYFVSGGDAGSPTAYRIDGATPVRISTHAQEEQWKGHLIDCISYVYEEDGHVFWVINSGNEAWAWDETEKSWGRRMQWNGAQFVPYETYFHTFIQEWGVDGTHITGGDVHTARIYHSSCDFYDDAGQNMAWRRALPYRYNANRQLYFGRMDLEMQTGTTSGGIPAAVVRDYSDDRGETFVNPQLASIGFTGQFSLRVFWPTGGASYGRVWRLFGQGQYFVALIDLECEETLGTV